MSRLAICALVSGLGLWLLTGCGESGPVRHAVTGKVLFKKQPLDEGIIDFEPMDGQGSKSGATISNGEYRIPRDKGLFAGRYKVTIIGGDGRSGEGMAEPSDSKGPFIPGSERIPPEYNLNSKIIREVTDDGPNEFDFDI